MNHARMATALQRAGQAGVMSLVLGFGSAAHGGTPTAPVAEILDSVSVPAASNDGSEISELSGLAWDEDEQLLYAVSDGGSIVHFRILVKDGKLAKVEPVLVAPLEEFEGSLLKLTWSLSNAEAALTRNSINGKRGDTELVVALEDGPAIARFTPAGQFIAEIVLPPPLGDAAVYANSNKRLESVSEIPGKGIITAPETPLRGGPQDIHTIYGSKGASWKFKTFQPRNSAIKDIYYEPGGRLLVLERTRDDAGENTELHLRLVDIGGCSTGGLCAVTEVVASDPDRLKLAFEGMTRIADGLYLLVSDEVASSTGGGQLLLFRLAL